MIHLITRVPHSYHLVLGRILHEAYKGDFVAWFNTPDPNAASQSTDDWGFAHHFLSECGYSLLFRSLMSDSEAIVILGGWSSPMTVRTLLMTTLLNVPVLIWADHPHPRARRRLFAFGRKQYLRLIGWKVKGFLACGEPTVAHLAELGLRREKIYSFPYWVDLPETWGLPPGCSGAAATNQALKLMVVGRQVPLKSFEVAIEAVSLANQHAGKTLAELCVVGDGPERQHLELLTKRLSAESFIRFTGWLDNSAVLTLLDNVDALILPSIFEPYGVVLPEAMAHGRPVFASDGVIAAIDRYDGSSGIVFHHAGDRATLAKQIVDYGSDRKKLRLASLAARSIAEKWEPSRAPKILDQILVSTKRGKSLRSNADGGPQIKARSTHA